jgi:hypothetical protein
MSSTDIAGLTGGFNQQIMLQQQQSAMLTQQFGGYSPNPYNQPVASRGEQYGGALVNTMGHLGSAVSAGVSAFVPGGSAIMAPFDYAGGQAMHGIHQQQQLDMSLRQSYRFANQAGGRGFQGMETAAIGSNLRQMSHQRGPGGETASFEELGQLASNMGRMGMAEGVRSAKDFNEKFKQMLTTVKTIATELGTSLEEAQKVMASLKGSGIFHNQGKFAGSMRIGALGGNMSIAEMSSAAQMGSQISRSVGGLGKSGAQAGINTLSNIGAATQAGIMSEEDIYNATGLTGAEGRQAMAQNMMSQDAEFFSGGKGRRVLASIAGKNGTIDDKAVARYMAGGVSTGDTMNMAHEHLGKTGRANFIRNEGRLRGEGMRAFGGLGKAIAAKDWFESRGLDLNGDDDRAMLGFQRMFNVGRDEADQMVKMASNLDTIMEQRQSAASNDKYSRRLDEQKRRGSPEEIMKRLDMAKQKINDSLAEMGTNWYKGIATTIDEYLGQMTGEYIQERRASISTIASKVMKGGTGSKEMVRRELGLAKDASGNLVPVQGMGGDAAAKNAFYGTGQLTESQFNRYKGANAQMFREQGVDISGAQSVDDVSRITQRLSRTNIGFSTAEGSTKVSSELSGKFKDILTNQGLEGSNDKFIAGIQDKLNTLGPEGVRLAAQIYRADAGKQGEMVRDLLDKASPTAAANYSSRITTPSALGAQGGPFATQGARDLAIGGAILGKQKPKIDWGKSGNDWRTWGGDMSNSHFGGNATNLGATANWVVEGIAGQADKYAAHDKKLYDGAEHGGAGDTKRAYDALYAVSDTQKKTISEYARSDEAQSNMGALLTGSTEERQHVLATLQARQEKLLATPEDKRSPQEKAEVAVHKAQMAYARVKGGEKAEDVSKSAGYEDVEDMMGSISAVGGQALGEQSVKRAQVFGEIGERARGNLEANAAEEKEIDTQIANGDIKLSPSAQSYRDLIQTKKYKEARFTNSDNGGNDKIMGQIQSLDEKMAKLDRGTVQQRKALAASLARTNPEEAASIASSASLQDRLEKGAARWGGGGEQEVIAGALGVRYEKGEFNKTKAPQNTKTMMDRLGIAASTKLSAADKASFGKSLKEIEEGFSYDAEGRYTVMSSDEKAKKLKGLQEKASVVAKETQEKTSDASDPSYRKLGDIHDSLEKLAKTTLATRLMPDTIANLAKAMKDHE